MVSHYMSPELFGVAEQDSWVTVADAFRAKHVRRLPVLRDGKLVGIVTRHDLMHAIRDARRRVRQRSGLSKAEMHGESAAMSQIEKPERFPQSLWSAAGERAAATQGSD